MGAPRRHEALGAGDGGGRARAGPAREGDADAALPHDEIDAVARDTAELDVRAARELRVRGQAGAEVIDVAPSEGAEEDGVRVAGVGDRDDDALAVDVDGPIAEAGGRRPCRP